jgi:hypothetical protein
MGALYQKQKKSVGALYDTSLDPTTPEEVAQWSHAQGALYTPGDWKTQLMNDLANIFPRVGATEDQNIYRSLQAGMGIMGSRGTGGTPAGVLSANVYHGSPHLFDKFEMSKVGTGEGAQAYGHGLYFADNPEVAKTYQKEFVPLIPFLKGLKQGKNLKDELPAGHLYKVDLPDEHIGKMLDWDKPISADLRARVIAALPENQRDLSGMVVGSNRSASYRSLVRGEADMDGAQLYNLLEQNLGKQKATEVMRSVGIPGIKYLDAGSREAGKGTSNYVVFDDSIPKIIGRE